MSPNIIVSHNDEGWPEMAHGAIVKKIHEAIAQQGFCRMMLTGGRTASRLYDYWAKSAVLPFSQMRFYFGDERCVPPEHEESNYGLVMRTLFRGQTSSVLHVERMEAEKPDRERVARAYENVLPAVLDVLLLGMGEDAHVASLFPNNPALMQTDKRIVPVKGPKPPHERLTITRKVIMNCTSVFLLITGKEKGAVLKKVIQSPSDFKLLPASLTINGTWLLDHAAGSGLE